MGFTIAQSAQAATTNIAATSLAVPLNTTKTGNLLVCCFNGGTNHLTSLSDGTNTYAAADIGHFSWSSCEIWYAQNITGLSSPTITASFSAMPATMQVYEVAGADPDSPLSTHNNASGDGVTSNSPTLTTSALGAGTEILFATGGLYLGAGTDAFTAGAGFTNLLAINSTPTVGITVNSGAELMIAGPGAKTANFIVGATGTTWEITTASFKALRNYGENYGKYLSVGSGMSRSEVAN